MATTFQPTRSAADGGGGAAATLRRRLGYDSWAQMAAGQLVFALAARRGGVLGMLLRRLLYRLVFASAPAPVLFADVHVTGPGRIRLGRNCVVEPGVLLDAKAPGRDRLIVGERTVVRAGAVIDTGWDGYVHLGDDVMVGPGSEFRGHGGVTVGNHSLIAGGARLIANEHLFDDPDAPIRDQGVKAAPVVVGSDVWIGANAVLTAGVTVGDGAVVGANAVVTRDVPAGHVVVGVPARTLQVRDGFAPST